MNDIKTKTIGITVQDGIKYYIWGYFEKNKLLTYTYIDAIIDKNANGGYSYNMVLRKRNPSGNKSRNDDILLSNIEYKSINYMIMISEEYFNNVILPLDRE